MEKAQSLQSLPTSTPTMLSKRKNMMKILRPLTVTILSPSLTFSRESSQNLLWILSLGFICKITLNSKAQNRMQSSRCVLTLAEDSMASLPLILNTSHLDMRHKITLTFLASCHSVDSVWVYSKHQPLSLCHIAFVFSGILQMACSLNKSHFSSLYSLQNTVFK